MNKTVSGSRLVLLLALAVHAGGCGVLSGRPMQVERPRGVIPTGVRWRDLSLGGGAVAGPSDTVLLHWTAHIEGGQHVDSTYDRGQAETISLVRPPFLGLADGVVGMRVHGRRRLVIPPHRAFGHEGFADLVPPDATLVLDVELVEILPAHTQETSTGLGGSPRAAVNLHRGRSRAD